MEEKTFQEKKLRKALKDYGVPENEHDEFVNYLDQIVDEEENEEPNPTENDEVKEEPAPVVDEEEKQPNNEDGGDEPTEQKEVDPSNDEQAEEPKAEEEVVKEDEEVSEEEKAEEEPPLEEKGEETTPNPEFDYNAKFEEMQKANDGFAARIAALEDIVSKLGVPTEDGFGASPKANPVDEPQNTFLDELNRRRMG